MKKSMSFKDKCQALRSACLDYQKYLSEKIKYDISMLDDEDKKSFIFNLDKNKRITSIDVFGANDNNEHIRAMVLKYNAVHRMLVQLGEEAPKATNFKPRLQTGWASEYSKGETIQPALTVTMKAIKEIIEEIKPILQKQRDPASELFVNTLLHILSPFGVTKIGFWKSYGEKTTDKMNKICDLPEPPEAK